MRYESPHPPQIYYRMTSDMKLLMLNIVNITPQCEADSYADSTHLNGTSAPGVSDMNCAAFMPFNIELWGMGAH